jgi:hypothetical protein
MFSTTMLVEAPLDANISSKVSQSYFLPNSTTCGNLLDHLPPSPLTLPKIFPVDLYASISNSTRSTNGAKKSNVDLSQ